MNRVQRVLVAAAGICILAGCSSPPAEPMISDRDFVEMSNDLASFATYNENGLDEAATGVCDAMKSSDDESSWLLAVEQLTDEGASPRDAGSFIAYAVSHRCSDMLDRLPSS